MGTLDRKLTSSPVPGFGEVQLLGIQVRMLKVKAPGCKDVGLG